MKRREIFQCGERAYFVRVTGRISQFEYLMQLAELVADTSSPDLPDTAG
ncbi:hypothetical protein ACIHCQ_25175 [Streptomyces sp. NPDC052236]